MTKRKPIDPSMLNQLVQSSQTQEVQNGTPRTTDKNFPLFATPVNEDVIVYFPKTNVRSDESGEVMEMLNSHLHAVKLGRSNQLLRCVNNLGGNPVFDQLGYDGTCPACDAMQEVWELYNLKYKAEANRLGIDPENDPNDTLKDTRSKLVSEMAIKAAEEYVTFPVAILPTKDKFVPKENAHDEVKVVFVQWRKQRYNDAIMSALEALPKNPGHPAGMLWFWKFSYDTKGKQPTAMMSAKNAKYSVIQDSATVELFRDYMNLAEEKAKDFTIFKAAEVVVANHFLYRDEIEEKVNKILAPTRQLLETAKMSGGAPALPTGQPAGQLGAGNPLANFGTAPEAQGEGAQGTAPQTPPANPIQFQS